MKEFHPFAPVIFENSTVLILGTFPSIKSFENNFYYSNPKNQFWPILSDIFKTSLKTLEDKIEFLKKHQIALWDIVKSCERKNSSDNNLKNVEVNDLDKLLKKYPKIKYLLFTGKKSMYFYNKYHQKLNLEIYYLPSPSPAYASITIKDKIKIYEKIFKETQIIH